MILNIRHYHSIVEQAIANLGVTPEECKGEILGVWNLKRGSATINVEIYVNEANNMPYCRVYCQFMEVPQIRLEEFYRELLELNMQHVGITFCLFENWVYLKSDREAEGLDVNEIYLMLVRIGAIADGFDDTLKNKYDVI